MELIFLMVLLIVLLSFVTKYRPSFITVLALNLAIDEIGIRIAQMAFCGLGSAFSRGN
ncbi:hypothetical protein KODAMA_02320 [Serratia phage vB_SmaM-Kodama]|nr:hypothetical protein KODAMA_02320 [Serratia phage vB_SmaM-Kodama]